MMKKFLKYKNKFQLLAVLALQNIFPQLAARIFSQLWFRVEKYKPHASLGQWKSTFVKIPITYKNTTLYAYSKKASTDKGQVLFLHGWSGRCDQFLELSEYLYQNGYSIVLFDLPAHGENSGNRSNIFEFAQFLQNVNSEISLNNSFVVCHSAGFLSWSLFSKLVPANITRNLVLISCPGSFDYLIDVFASKLKFNKKLIAELWKIIASKGNTNDLKELLSVAHMSMLKDEDVLIIHDKKDYSVSFTEAPKLQNLWPKSTIIETTGLGHNKILKSNELANVVSNFLNTIS